MSIHQIEAIITGRVQAVGFRRFIYREARKIGGLAGFAENLKDKSVRVVAKGPENGLKQLIVRLNQGPFIARVDYVQVTWESVENGKNPPAENNFSDDHNTDLPQF